MEIATISNVEEIATQIKGGCLCHRALNAKIVLPLGLLSPTIARASLATRNNPRTGREAARPARFVGGTNGLHSSFDPARSRERALALGESIKSSDVPNQPRGAR